MRANQLAAVSCQSGFAVDSTGSICYRLVDFRKNGIGMSIPGYYPNAANLLPAKTAKLAPEYAICALARLGQDLTRTVRYVSTYPGLREAVSGVPWRVFLLEVCNLRVKIP